MDADVAGLEHYLEELQKGLRYDLRVKTALANGENPLDILTITKQNIIQFTTPRLYAAVSVVVAAEELSRKYLGGHKVEARVKARGVQHAKALTEKAITEVLGLVHGINYGSYSGTYDGLGYKYRIKFPFHLDRQHAVIDAIALSGPGIKGPEAEADHFVKKVSNLRRIDSDVRPYATVAIGDRDPELGRDLIGYIRHELHLSEQDIVEATEPNTLSMVRAIRERAA
jgi:hypothetical protein